ncbi:hypothetical protein C2W62_31260 [Candidatus Entotheonella serta]|nr:hypothetical protein C2W62_31260 [Candidatus Entotheonella serta]
MVNDLATRDPRDRMIDILGLGRPYPFRDLILRAPPVVAKDLTTQILIEGAQAGVSYQLCDEEGNPIYNKADRKP